MKETVVIGASPNPSRYAYLAVKRLLEHRQAVQAVGLRKGNIEGVEIQTDLPDLKNIHTVTLYVGPKNQGMWIPYILNLRPKRIIFNPGTENPEFYRLAKEQNIEILEACTLVMLAVNSY